MVMSNEEIVRYYRQAKDQKGSIQILADLNVTSKSEILTILKNAGEIKPEEPRSTKSNAKGQQTFKFDEDTVMQLYKQGLSDEKIGKQIGVSQSTIWNWRKARALPSNKDKHPKQKKTIENMKKIIENHEGSPQNNLSPISRTDEISASQKINPVLLKIQKILDLVSPTDSAKIAGQYLDLMITMLSNEVQRIVNAG